MMNINLFLFLINLLIFSSFKFGTVEGIVGGQDAVTGQFKFMVSIYADNEYICSGAILEERHVLTAANCFIDEHNEFKQKTFTVHVGNINLQLPTPAEFQIEIERIHVPKEFKSIATAPGLVPNIEIGDIAVVTLKRVFDLSHTSQFSKVQFPKRVIRSFKKYFNEKPYVIGFGIDSQRGMKRDRQNSEISRIPHFKLRFAETLVHHKTFCKNLYKFPFREEHLCAQIIQNESNLKQGTCMGDNGAPLVLNDNTIIGVLARYTPDCNERSSASLYTRVTSFMPFIKNVIDDHIYTNIRVASYKSRPQAGPSQGAAEYLVETTKAQ